MGNKKDRLLLLQCDSGEKNGNLIACARHIVWDEFFEKSDQITELEIKTHVVFIIQLPRIAGGCFVGFEVRILTSNLMYIHVYFLQ